MPAMRTGAGYRQGRTLTLDDRRRPACYLPEGPLPAGDTRSDRFRKQTGQ